MLSQIQHNIFANRIQTKLYWACIWKFTEYLSSYLFQFQIFEVHISCLLHHHMEDRCQLLLLIGNCLIIFCSVFRKLHWRSHKQKRKNKPLAMFDYGPCDWLVLSLLLPTRQPSFHWIISDGVINGVRRNGDILILPTPIPSNLWLRLRLRFLIFTRSLTTPIKTPTPTPSLMKTSL